MKLHRSPSPVHLLGSPIHLAEVNKTFLQFLEQHLVESRPRLHQPREDAPGTEELHDLLQLPYRLAIPSGLSIGVPLLGNGWTETIFEHASPLNLLSDRYGFCTFLIPIKHDVRISFLQFHAIDLNVGICDAYPCIHR